MKKIMFSDKFLITQAVLEGRKTQTRRVIPNRLHDRINAFANDYYEKTLDFLYGKDLIEAYMTNYPGELPYKVGEIVAVAQNYCSIADELENCNNATCAAHYEKNVQKASEYISWMEHPGFNNKMFVAADMMIHRIRITGVRLEHLQDISDEDCLKEGIEELSTCSTADGKAYTFNGVNESYMTPREAFAHLINKVSKKGTWEANPYVFVYDFESIK